MAVDNINSLQTPKHVLTQAQAKTDKHNAKSVALTGQEQQHIANEPNAPVFMAPPKDGKTNNAQNRQLLAQRYAENSQSFNWTAFAMQVLAENTKCILNFCLSEQVAKRSARSVEQTAMDCLCLLVKNKIMFGRASAAMDVRTDTTTNLWDSYIKTGRERMVRTNPDPNIIKSGERKSLDREQYEKGPIRRNERIETLQKEIPGLLLKAYPEGPTLPRSLLAKSEIASLSDSNKAKYAEQMQHMRSARSYLQSFDLVGLIGEYNEDIALLQAAEKAAVDHAEHEHAARHKACREELQAEKQELQNNLEKLAKTALIDWRNYQNVYQRLRELENEIEELNKIDPHKRKLLEDDTLKDLYRSHSILADYLLKNHDKPFRIGQIVQDDLYQFKQQASALANQQNDGQTKSWISSLAEQFSKWLGDCQKPFVKRFDSEVMQCKLFQRKQDEAFRERVYQKATPLQYQLCKLTEAIAWQTDPENRLANIKEKLQESPRINPTVLSKHLNNCLIVAKREKGHLEQVKENLEKKEDVAAYAGAIKVFTKHIDELTKYAANLTEQINFFEENEEIWQNLNRTTPAEQPKQPKQAVLAIDNFDDERLQELALDYQVNQAVLADYNDDVPGWWNLLELVVFRSVNDMIMGSGFNQMTYGTAEQAAYGSRELSQETLQTFAANVQQRRAQTNKMWDRVRQAIKADMV